MNEWELAQQICDMPEVDEVIRGFAEDQTGDNATMIVREVIRALKVQPQHSDDIAVDRFAAAMKNKLAKKREEGRSGWETATPEYLSKLLLDHVAKGDPIDVANFCAMLFASESRIQFNENEPMNEEYWFKECGWLHQKISELKAQLQDQQSTQEPCKTCDGQVSVHSPDGEYRGECPFCSKQLPAQDPVKTQFLDRSKEPQKKIIILHSGTSLAYRHQVAEMIKQLSVDQGGFLKKNNDRPYLKRKKGRS